MPCKQHGVLLVALAASYMGVARGAPLLASQCGIAGDNQVDCAVLLDLAKSTLVGQWDKSTHWPGGKTEDGQSSVNGTKKPKSMCDWHGITCDSEMRVTNISLKENGLCGSLPATLGNVEMLQELSIAGNRPDGYGLKGKSCLVGPDGTNPKSSNFKSTGFPDSMYTLKHLSTLSAENACIGGTLSSKIGDMKALAHILIHANYISGTLPVELDNLENLVDHKLGRNPISGTLPAFTKPKLNLEKYNCNFCALTGTFPDTFSPKMYPKLSQAFWDGNGFTGELPGSIGSLPTMQVMSFNINNFGGKFPLEFCKTKAPDCRIGADTDLVGYQAVYPWVQALNVSGNVYDCGASVPVCIRAGGVCNHTSKPHAGQEVDGSPVQCM